AAGAPTGAGHDLPDRPLTVRAIGSVTALAPRDCRRLRARGVLALSRVCANGAGRADPLSAHRPSTGADARLAHRAVAGRSVQPAAIVTQPALGHRRDRLRLRPAR